MIPVVRMASPARSRPTATFSRPRRKLSIWVQGFAACPRAQRTPDVQQGVLPEAHQVQAVSEDVFAEIRRGQLLALVATES